VAKKYYLEGVKSRSDDGTHGESIKGDYGLGVASPGAPKPWPRYGEKETT